MASEFEYDWGDEPYPSFYPAADELSPGRFIVELSITCYPYKNGSSFDDRAFPESLKNRGYDGSTRFVFIARDEDGNVIENLEWLDACVQADILNDDYHEVLYECANNLHWDECPYELNVDDVLWSK